MMNYWHKKLPFFVCLVRKPSGTAVVFEEPIHIKLFFLSLCSISLLIVEYFVPLAIISFAYMRIAFRLWGSRTPGAAQDQRDHNILVNKKKVTILTSFIPVPPSMTSAIFTCGSRSKNGKFS